MADESTSTQFQIHIVSDADNAGFTSAAGAATTMGAASSQAGDKSEDAGKQIKKAGEEAKESGLSHRELGKVFRDIGTQLAPQMGGALMELAYGPVGAGLFLVGVFEAFRETLEGVNSQLEQTAELAAQPLDGGIKAVKDAWDEAAKSAGEYYAKMQSAGEDSDPIGTQIARLKDLAAAQIEASKKIVEARGKEEIAAIRVQQAQNPRGTPELTEKLVADAEARTQAQMDALDQSKADATGVAALKAEQQMRAAANPELQNEANAANERAAQAKRQYDDFQASLALARKAVGVTDEDKKSSDYITLQKRFNDANDALDAAKALPTEIQPTAFTGGGPIDNTAARAEKIREAQSELEIVQAEIAGNAKLLAQLEAKEEEVTRQKAEADQAAEAARDKSIKNQARIRQLPGEIDQATKIEDINQGAAGTAELLGKTQRAIVNNANAGLTGNAVDAQRELANSQAVGRQVAEAAKEAAAAHSDSLKIILQALADLRASNIRLIQQITAMPSQGR